MDFLPMCLESVKSSDKIIYLDGGSTDGSIEYAESKEANILKFPYSQENPEQNSKSRYYYLQYLKTNFVGDWCLVLDADEVVQDFDNLKEDISHLNDTLYSIKMRHLIYNFALEDATKEKHYVPNRFFKITEDLFYPSGEHLPLNSKIKVKNITENYDGITIWHLAISNLSHIRNRYIKNLKHSAVHSKDFLNIWYRHLLFGTYPIRKIDLNDLPREILNHYQIDKDEIYFNNRGLEIKHFLEVLQWKNEFQPINVLDVGCGLGARVFVFNNYGINCEGFDNSNWAIEHTMVPGKVYLDNLEDIKIFKKTYNLVIVYDVLEHLTELGDGIKNLRKLCNKYLLVSIPVIGDPNLLADNTHKQYLYKWEWIERINEAGFRLKETPKHFMYEQQILIFEVI